MISLNACRICLQTIKNQISFNLSSEVDGFIISKFLIEQFDFFEKSFFDKPDQICISCVNLIKSAKELRQKCLDSQYTFFESFKYVGVKSEDPEHQSKESDNQVKLESDQVFETDDTEIKDEDALSNEESQPELNEVLKNQEIEEQHELPKRRSIKSKNDILESKEFEFVCEISDCLAEFDKNFKLVNHRIEVHKDDR
jgi:hypothetical protein